MAKVKSETKVDVKETSVEVPMINVLIPFNKLEEEETPEGIFSKVSINGKVHRFPVGKMATIPEDVYDLIKHVFEVQ